MTSYLSDLQGLASSSKGARLILEHLSRHLTVKDYGAVGDGITDDTAAIQKAIDEASVSRGHVHLPRGIFLVSGLKMHTGVRLFGDGIRTSILRLKASATAAAIELSSIGVYGTVLENFGIQGNRTAQNSSSARGVYYLNSQTAPIDESGAKHILRDLHVEYTYGDGINMDVTDGSCLLMNVYVLHANKKGFRLNLPDSMIVACHAGQSGEEGFYITGRGANRFSTCKVYRSGRLDETQGTGFFVNSDGNQFAACASQDNKLHGWDIFQAHHNAIHAAESESNGFTATNRSQAAYRVNAGTYNLIQGTAWNRGASDMPSGGGNRYNLSLVNSPTDNTIAVVGSDAVTQAINGATDNNTVTVT